MRKQCRTTPHCQHSRLGRQQRAQRAHPRTGQHSQGNARSRQTAHARACRCSLVRGTHSRRSRLGIYWSGVCSGFAWFVQVQGSALETGEEVRRQTRWVWRFAIPAHLNALFTAVSPRRYNGAGQPSPVKPAARTVIAVVVRTHAGANGEGGFRLGLGLGLHGLFFGLGFRVLPC